MNKGNGAEVIAQRYLSASVNAPVFTERYKKGLAVEKAAIRAMDWK